MVRLSDFFNPGFALFGVCLLFFFGFLGLLLAFVSGWRKIKGVFDG